MNQMRKKIRSALSRCLWLLGCLTLSAGCNKEFDDLLSKKDSTEPTEFSSGKRKVLYIILDGVKGSVLSGIKPNNLTKMQRNAIYSYNALADYRTGAMTNATGWANMITGVNASKHSISDENFAGAKLDVYPSIFTRLKAEAPSLKTLSVATSAIFNDQLAIDANEKFSAASDQVAKETVINKLQTTDVDFMVAQFHSAETAGASGGYSSSNSSYIQSINTLDAYISEMVEAIKSRKTYNGENWLVIVAANKGGADGVPRTDLSAFGDPVRNTYLMFYNPKLDTKLVPKPSLDEVPYVGKAPRFASDLSKTGQAVLSDAAIGNFGTSGNYTLAFKFRSNVTNAANYSYPLGKMSAGQYNAPRTSSLDGTGWTYMFWGNSYYLCVTNNFTHNAGVNVLDGKWHVLGFKVYQDGNTRYVKVFTDNVKSGEISIQGKNLTNAAAMHIGTAKATAANNVTNFLIQDLAIYNIAMTDEDMQTYMKREVTPSSPFYGNLIGWWPMKEGAGNRLADGQGKNYNFTTTEVPWVSFNDFSPNIYPEIQPAAYVTVPNSVDIPYQVYNWFGIPVTAAWNLDGRAWSGNYLTTITN